MNCKYLKKIKPPAGHRRVTHEDDAGEFACGGDSEGAMMWLCRYVIETGKGGSYGVRHCPYEDGPDAECLFAADGGPFPPADKK